MMLAQLFCLCWLCGNVIVLGSDGASETIPGSLIVDFGLILYVVSVSGGIGAA